MSEVKEFRKKPVVIEAVQFKSGKTPGHARGTEQGRTENRGRYRSPESRGAAMTEFTERQAAAWPGAVAEAQRYVETSTIPEDIDHPAWLVKWDDETRPGRGHTFWGTWSDGEYLVQVVMDVYGYPAVSVAETRWLHSNTWEECDCDYCEREEDHDV